MKADIVRIRKGGGRQKVHESDSARVAAWRAKKGLKNLTILIKPETKTKLDAFMLARDETKSEVVERALQYFFRKR